MKWWCSLLYKRELSKWPDTIPYENLSKLMTWKIQKQVYYSELTISKFLWGFVKQCVIIPIKCFWFNLHYYKDESGFTKNSLTDIPVYVHKDPGLFAHYNKPCRPDCKFCKKTITIYSEK